MPNMIRNFWNDEQGVIISAELVLVMTIIVIGMTVGLSEVAHAVVAELNDVGDAIGSLNQSFFFTGFHGLKTTGFGGGFGGGGFAKAWTPGSAFIDIVDVCDNNQCMIACDSPVAEAAMSGAGGGWW